MREHKYRAWDKEARLFIKPDVFDSLIEGREIHGISELDMMGKKPTDLVEGVRYSGNPFKMGRLIVMQYTGLKDKNGVEIYEGDILKAPYFQTSAIEYINSGFWCKQENGANMLPNLDDAEVIGNIYENPELLGKEG